MCRSRGKLHLTGGRFTSPFAALCKVTTAPDPGLTWVISCPIDTAPLWTQACGVPLIGGLGGFLSLHDWTLVEFVSPQMCRVWGAAVSPPASPAGFSRGSWGFAAASGCPAPEHSIRAPWQPAPPAPGRHGCPPAPMAERPPDVMPKASATAAPGFSQESSPWPGRARECSVFVYLLTGWLVAGPGLPACGASLSLG